MQSTITDFINAASEYYKQGNFIKEGEAWSNLCTLAKNHSSSAESSLSLMDNKSCLLFCLTVYDEGNERDKLLRSLFSKTLITQLDSEFVNALFLLNHQEIVNNLLPFIYESGNRGSSAVYLAAKLDVKLSSSVFVNFLSSRQWSQADLINLSFLVIPEEKDELIDLLTSKSNSNSAQDAQNSQTYIQFVHVLLSASHSEPIAPILAEKGKTLNIGSSSVFSTFKNAQTTNKPTSNVSVSKTQVPPAIGKHTLEKTDDSSPKKFKLTNSKTNFDLSATIQKASGKKLDNSENTSPIQPKPVAPKNNIKPQKTEELKASNKATATAKVDNKPTNFAPKKEIKQETSVEAKNEQKIEAKAELEQQPDKSKTIAIASNQNKKSLSDNNSEKIIETMNNFFDSFKGKSFSDGANNFYKKYKNAIITCVFIFTLGTLILMIVTTESDAPQPKIKTNNSSKEAREWIDVNTNKLVNEKSIRADCDYQTGELYLTRNMYDRALKCFEDALAIDNNHLNSLIRSAHCYTNLGNTQKAIENLNAALKISPKGNHINMYMARAYKAQHDSKNAIKYYEKELSSAMDLTIGLEYANYLNSIGDSNKAMEMLSKLQSIYPNNDLTLSDNMEAGI